MPDLPGWLDVNAAARHLSLSLAMFLQRVKRGELPRPSHHLDERSPRWSRAALDAVPKGGSAPGAAPARSAKKRRILVVHDNENFLGRVASALATAGFEVVPCSSSMTALDILDGPQPIDLLVTRIGFKEPPNGVALARMAKIKRRVPVLFVANPKMEGHALDIGDFLPASATPGEIVTGVLRILCPGRDAER